MEKTRQMDDGFENYPKRLTGKDYLQQWKLSGGYDPVDAIGYSTGADIPSPFEERDGKKS